ncbi:peptidoglycan-binding protein [Plantactinospora sp. KBS50]|uniref:peptidoglycan-binding protein n=1 Tax=Plantactinospora sp. KBS50 TaxID=2024580 RepID=UPI0012FE4799|nr:peptidoglycan-binding protein [Plantactinospora sp. KBS50]
MKSPQQLAAEAKGPNPTTLTAEVVQRPVRRTVVVRGETTSLQLFTATPVPSTDATRPVVTGVYVKQGDEVKAGTVLVEVAGRPLIALPGVVPAYRDLRPGATGKDIAQLQQALRRLGHAPDEYDGRFGSGTKHAVSALYSRLGYSVPTTGEADAAAVQAAEAAVVQAERRVDDARDLAEADPETPGGTASHAQAVKQLDRAKEDLAVARDRLEQLKRTTGPMLPQSEVIFLPSFPARVPQLKAIVGADVTSPLVTLASGPLVVRSDVSPAQRELLQQGMPANVVIGSDAEVGADVTSIGALQQNDGQPSTYPVFITPKKPLDASSAGLQALVTVEIASSGKDVLAVPVSALFSGADGKTYLLRADPTGEQQVAVVAGISGEGFVAVTPASGDLAPGDRVVIGVRSGDGGS